MDTPNFDAIYNGLIPILLLLTAAYILVKVWAPARIWAHWNFWPTTIITGILSFVAGFLVIQLRSNPEPEWVDGFTIAAAIVAIVPPVLMYFTIRKWDVPLINNHMAKKATKHPNKDKG